MAANYSVSTQRTNWTFDSKLDFEKAGGGGNGEEMLIGELPLPESRLQKIYLQQQMTKLGRRLNVRQTVHATAMVFIHRFYCKVEMKRTNLYLVLSTALYLACKIEECPQHIRVVANEARNLWPDFIQVDVARLGECEFIMISELKTQLIVHHPYRHLFNLQKQLSLTQDDLNLAWSIVNDHYLTEIPLLHSPQTMAVAAVVLAVTIRPSQNSHNGLSLGAAIVRNPQLAGLQSRGQALHQHLSQSSVDVEGVADCTQEMISLYVAWEEYSEKTCKEQIGRYIKAKGLDK